MERNKKLMNIRMDDALKAKAAEVAASQGMTLSDFIRQAVAEKVERSEPAAIQTMNLQRFMDMLKAGS